jgi:hypothetical protein
LQKRLAAAAFFVAALALISCGGSDGGGDEEAIEEMMIASVYARGPESCLKYSTVKYLEMTTRREGDAAVEACEESELDPTEERPTGVEVSEIDVAGSSSTAVIAFEGSTLDGQKLRVRLIERGGRWKYYEWLGFADFDAERLILQVGREGMLQADSAREAEAIACVIGQMEEMEPEGLEKEVFESSEPLSELWDNCNAGSSAT